MKIKIKDLTGEVVEVTNLYRAIRECRAYAHSPYKMESGYTVGENHAFMLAQLLRIKRERGKDKA